MSTTKERPQPAERAEGRGGGAPGRDRPSEAGLVALLGASEAAPDQVRFGLGHVATAALAALAVVAIDTAIAPGPGEASWLRWMRVAAEHPVRIGLATALAHFAALPSRRARVDERS